jgi:hypothetical protein
LIVAVVLESPASVQFSWTFQRRIARRFWIKSRWKIPIKVTYILSWVS